MHSSTKPALTSVVCLGSNCLTTEKIISGQSEGIGVLLKNNNPGVLNQSNFQGNHHISKKKITISGARRIWGTLISTLVKAVKNVISLLSSISSDNLLIKRNTRMSIPLQLKDDSLLYEQMSLYFKN